MKPTELPPEEFARRLAEAPLSELLALVKEPPVELTVPLARAVLRNPHADAAVLEQVALGKHLLAAPDLRRELVFHPRVPEILAQRLLPGLFWRDLVELSADVKARPRLRQAAERIVGERLPALSEGEKVAIARRAGAGLLTRLRFDPSRRVFAALLENPRLTEAIVVTLAVRDATPAQVLMELAENPRWGVRYEVRLALARNPSTPVDLALRQLSSLKKADLKALLGLPRVAAAVRRRAQLLLGGA